MPKHSKETSGSEPTIEQDPRSPSVTKTEPRFGPDTVLGSAPNVRLPANPNSGDCEQDPSRVEGHSWSSLADELIEAINHSSHDQLSPVRLPPSSSPSGDHDEEEDGPMDDLYTVPSLPDIGDVADTLMFNKVVKRSESQPEEAGDLIGGRYRPIESLGDGGMARLFKVEHVSLGKHFALKVIQKEYWDDAQVRQMFFREAKVASKLDHPNIVQVTDFGVDQTYGAYIVMELLKGQTLRARLNESPVPVSAALDVMLQIASALHYMHNQNFIHCDVKSENVFLCRQPEGERQRHLVKIIDFGLSKAEALGAKLARSEVGGTPEYIAPEQIRGKAPQPSMDIYALGVVFFEALTGELPFYGTAKELIQHHLKTSPPKLGDFLDELPDEQVEQLVQQLLEKDPAKRPQSAGQVVYHLRTIADMLGLSHAHARRRPTSTSPQKQTRALLELRAMVAHCPIPLFRVSADGILQTGNRAFFDFVRLEEQEAVGMPLEETRLRYIFPEVADRIVAAAATDSNVPVVRTARFERTDKPVSVKIMLMPEQDDHGDIHHFTGIIHSLNSE